MRLLKLEFKNNLKKRSTLIMAAAAVITALLFAVIAVMYASADIDDGNGNIKEVYGIRAIEYWEGVHTPCYGDVTPEKLKKVMKPYLEACEKYGDPEAEGFPKDVYKKDVSPAMPFAYLISKTYFDTRRGYFMQREASDVKLSEMDAFYDVRDEHFAQLLKEIRFSKEGKEKARALYSKVKCPFQLYGDYPDFALDFASLAILALVFIGASLSASVFSSDYESGADYIFRCTKFGKRRQAVSKLAASITTSALIYIIAITVHFIITDLCFGTESLKTSIQMIYDPVATVLNANVLQLQLLLAGAGLLTLISVCAFSFFVSARLEKSMASVGIAAVMVFAPMLIATALGDNWLSVIMPSGGVGSANAMLEQLTKLKFLSLGSNAFWMPRVTMFFSAVWIPLFVILSVKSYCKHQTR